MRRLVLAIGLLSALSALSTACSDDSSASSGSGDDTFEFRDAKGRQCSAKRFPPIATCNAQAAPSKGCAPGSSPCFVVSTGQNERTDAGLTGPVLVRNCDSCCKTGSNSSSNLLGDCSPLVCATPADCAGENADCVSGQCVAKR